MGTMENLDNFFKSAFTVDNVIFGFDEGDSIGNPPPVNEFYVLAFDTNAITAGALLVSSAGNTLREK